MDNSGAESFVYSKASGILGRSYVGARANVLYDVKSLSELWTLLFKTPSPMIPEVLLAEKIEEESFNVFIRQYIKFIECFDNPVSYLSDQLIILEVENLKEIVDSLCAGETKMPKLINLGKYNTLNLEGWPEIKKITENTEYAWLDTLPDIHKQQEIEYRLDIQAIKKLWNSACRIMGEDGVFLRQLYEEEFTLQNMVWALRLKMNYGMTSEEIIPKLMYVTEEPSLEDPVAAPAIKILDKNPENYNEWMDWRYKKYVNPKMDELWMIDPAWIESSARPELHKKAQRLFHNNPLSCVSLVGWYKIKQYELSCIRMAVESVRLHSRPLL